MAQHIVGETEIKGELFVYINNQISNLREELIEMFEEDFNKVIHDMETDFVKENKKIRKEAEEQAKDFETKLSELGEKLNKVTRKNNEFKTKLKEALLFYT